MWGEWEQGCGGRVWGRVGGRGVGVCGCLYTRAGSWPPGLGMARTWRDGVWQLGLALRLARLLLLLLLHLPLLVEDLLGLAVAD